MYTFTSVHFTFLSPCFSLLLLPPTSLLYPFALPFPCSCTPSCTPTPCDELGEDGGLSPLARY